MQLPIWSLILYHIVNILLTLIKSAHNFLSNKYLFDIASSFFKMKKKASRHYPGGLRPLGVFAYNIKTALLT